MIEVLPEVLVAKVGLGRVNTIGIHAICSRCQEQDGLSEYESCESS